MKPDYYLSIVWARLSGFRAKLFGVHKRQIALDFFQKPILRSLIGHDWRGNNNDQVGTTTLFNGHDVEGAKIRNGMRRVIGGLRNSIMPNDRSCHLLTSGYYSIDKRYPIRNLKPPGLRNASKAILHKSNPPANRVAESCSLIMTLFADAAVRRLDRHRFRPFDHCRAARRIDQRRPQREVIPATRVQCFNAAPARPRARPVR